MIVALSSIAILANGASAAVWQWGCMGALGTDQIAFNRERLAMIAGKGSAVDLDKFVLSDEIKSGGRGSAMPLSIVATYRPDDANSGLDKTIAFKREDAGSKLTLTELSSKNIGRSARLRFGCRDETFERTRKTYRLEHDKEPPRTVTLVCLEYNLSTRGGRTCK